MADARLVSIVVPCRNEAAFIDAFCADALRQALPPPWRLELIVADGHSDDGTRERLQSLAAAESRLHVVDNPARFVAAGLNRALAAARGAVIGAGGGGFYSARAFGHSCAPMLTHPHFDPVAIQLGPLAISARKNMIRTSMTQ